MRPVRAVWIVVTTAVAMAVAAFLLLPLPDSCDRPGSLVLCTTRSSAFGLVFSRNSALPLLAALAVILLIAVVGTAATLTSTRRARRSAAGEEGAVAATRTKRKRP